MKALEDTPSGPFLYEKMTWFHQKFVYSDNL